MSNIVSVNKNVTNVITVTAQGPQGIPGITPTTGSFAVTGSNTFIGNQTITGSVNILGSLNANAQVYEVSFLDRFTIPYSSGDNLIELDQDIITNSNYTRDTNTITINSSGSYKIYTQCRIISLNFSSEAAIYVVINGNSYRGLYIDNIKNTEISTYNFSCIANLNVNDTIGFRIYAPGDSYRLYNTARPLVNDLICSYATIEKLN